MAGLRAAEPDTSDSEAESEREDEDKAARDSESESDGKGAELVSAQVRGQMYVERSRPIIV
jgi:hypothetical protein